MLEAAWAALGGDPAAVSRLGVQGPPPWPEAALPVGELALATSGAALLAAAELAHARTGRAPDASLDAAQVAASFVSERHATIAGRDLGAPFDPVSAFFEARDGWVRLHANYPHHRAALLGVLGLPEGADRATAAAAVARFAAQDLEEAVVAAGGCAAAVRDEAAWRRHPHGAALAGRALLDLERGVAQAPPLAPGDARAARPAAGIRVLDLTRVIAGPVGGRTLAALGADVLRIDAPHLPEIELQVVDTGPGKRSALLDLGDPGDRATFDALLDQADVVLQGYRPGALAALGLDARTLAERRPGLVTVTLSAWGDGGPWAGRRGFDSLVQAATGIAQVSATAPDGSPGVLPCQALDHGTGHLMAAAALRGLAVREREGRALHARLALARTAAWLLDQPRGARPSPDDRPDGGGREPERTQLSSPFGDVTLVAPPGRLDGEPLRWDRGPVPLGTDAPRWR